MGVDVTAMRPVSMLLALLFVSYLMNASAQSLPSCEADMNAHCMDSEEYEDLMPAGIDRCLKGLATRSSDCDSYLKVVAACGSELKKGGICGAAMDDGEAMPCLILRTKPQDLSAGCVEALPKQKEAIGLKKFWSEGKRELDQSEESTLDAEELDDYKFWLKRKKKKTGRSQERDMAIKLAKVERATKIVTEAATHAAVGMASPSFGAVLEVVKAAYVKAMSEDLTKTLVQLSKSEFEKITKAAMKAAVKVNSEAKKEL